MGAGIGGGSYTPLSQDAYNKMYPNGTVMDAGTGGGTTGAIPQGATPTPGIPGAYTYKDSNGNTRAWTPVEGPDWPPTSTTPQGSTPQQGSGGTTGQTYNPYNAYMQYMQYMMQNPTYYQGNQGGYPGSYYGNNYGGSYQYGYNASANNPYMPAAVRNYGIPQYAGSGMYPTYGANSGYGGGYGGYNRQPMFGGLGDLGMLMLLGPYLQKMYGNTSGTVGTGSGLQTPTADPRIAQMQTQIDQLLAKIGATGGTTGGTTGGATATTPAITTTPDVAKWQAPTTAATDAAGIAQQIQNARSTATQGQGINAQTGANEVAAADWLVKNGFVPASKANSADPFNLDAARSNATIENALKGAAALGIPGFGTYNEGGRVGYSTGGKIPEMDAAFKHAKKYVDDHTKGLLDVHDDAIAHALHIAKGKM